MDTISKIRVKGVDYHIEDENAGDLEFIGSIAMVAGDIDTWGWESLTNYDGDTYMALKITQEQFQLAKEAIFVNDIRESLGYSWDTGDYTVYEPNWKFATEVLGKQDDYNFISPSMRDGEIYMVDGYQNQEFFICVTNETYQDIHNRTQYSDRHMINLEFYR